MILMNIQYNDRNTDEFDDLMLKKLDQPLSDSDEESDEYYPLCESEIESSKWRYMLSPWFQYLFEGIKKWDVQLQKNEWNNVNVDDVILYCGSVNECGKVCCMKIIDIKKFNNFTELIKVIPLHKIMPNITLDIDALALFHTWYSEEDEKKYGIIAVNLERIDN